MLYLTNNFICFSAKKKNKFNTYCSHNFYAFIQKALFFKFYISLVLAATQRIHAYIWSRASQNTFSGHNSHSGTMFNPHSGTMFNSHSGTMFNSHSGAMFSLLLSTNSGFKTGFDWFTCLLFMQSQPHLFRIIRLVSWSIN